jgi:hypothetical protein
MSSDEKRTEVVATRLSEREVRILEERAKAQELSVSNYVRARLFPESRKPKAEVQCD